MSNFADRLTELMERATKGELRYDHMGVCCHTGKNYGDINPYFAESVYEDDYEYIKFLFNHAPAIRDLVRAAEKAHKNAEELREAWRTGAVTSCDGKSGSWSAANVDVEVSLREALARLEEA